jgi:hypothetical protein
MTADDIIALTLETVTLAVQWVLVPMIMAGLVVLARSMVARAEEGERLTSARAGAWAGLVLFAIYFAQSLPAFRTPGLGTETGMTINILGIVLGTGLGAALLWGLSVLAPDRIIGVVVLLLTFAGLSSFHSYVFLETRNEFFVAAVLGTALGALFHMMVFPSSVERSEQADERQAEEVYRVASSRPGPPAGR